MAINYVSHRGILLEIYADLTLALGFGVDVVVVSGPAILTGSGVSGCLWALDPSVLSNWRSTSFWVLEAVFVFF